MIVLPSVNAGILNSNFFIKKDLVLHVDSSNINCYSGVGSTCKNLAKLDETGTLDSINFLNKSFIFQNNLSHIVFNRNFTASNNQATFLIILELQNPPNNNLYDIFNSTNPINVEGYSMYYGLEGPTDIKIYWDATNSFSSAIIATYVFPLSQLPKKIFICGTIDGSNIKLYINGYLVSQTALPIGFISNFYNDIYCGPNPALFETVSGTIIYEYLIYERGLSSDEVLQNFNAIKLKYNL